jgi:hypothetical protein
MSALFPKIMLNIIKVVESLKIPSPKMMSCRIGRLNIFILKYTYDDLSWSKWQKNLWLIEQSIRAIYHNGQI